MSADSLNNDRKIWLLATNNTFRGAPISLPVFRSRWPALGKRELWEQTLWKNKGNNRILVNRFTAHLHLWRMPEMVRLLPELSFTDRWARGTRLWERSRLPPMKALASHQCVPGSSNEGRVSCRFSTLLREVFLWVLRFSALLRNVHFRIPIPSWNGRTFLNEFLWTPWCSVGKQITFLL